MFAQLRKERGYTQQRLADELKVKQSTIAMWETGRAVPSMKNLLELSRIFEMTVDGICRALKNEE